MAKKSPKILAAEKARAEKLLKEQIKEMRPYSKKMKDIDLRSHISSGKKSYVKKLWAEYQELTARPHKVYRTKNKSRLRIAQDFSRHDANKPKFDVAFVPTPDSKARIKFKDDRAIIKSKYVTETVLFFDAKKLATNPKAHIAETLARNTDAKQFVIMSGKYLYNGGLARSLVEDEVLDLMARYSKTDENNYWANWLFGIAAYEFAKTDDFLQYRKGHFEKRATIRASKRNQRRTFQRKYGKKA